MSSPRKVSEGGYAKQPKAAPAPVSAPSGGGGEAPPEVKKMSYMKLKKECMSVFNEVEILKAELLGRYAAEAEVSFRHELATAAAARAAASFP